MHEAGSAPFRKVILVCCNEREAGEDACAHRGSVEIYRRLKEEVRARGLNRSIRVSRAMCLGLCAIGPNLCVMPDNRWYDHVQPEDVEGLLKEHVDGESA